MYRSPPPIHQILILICWLLPLLSGWSAPVVYSRLHSFGFTNRLGESPPANVILAKDGLLYGTTERGGRVGGGTLFKMSTNGTGYQVLRSFGISANDGQAPEAALLEASDGALYGTTSSGGSSNYGTVFKINKDGTGYTLLHSFQGMPNGGANPRGALVQTSDGILHGTTVYGGTRDGGTVFRINTNGTSFVLLRSFGTGSDGSNSMAGLLLASDGALYGTTFAGGSAGLGAVFKLSKSGTNYSYSVLRSFQSGAEGAMPQAGLVEASGLLFGCTSAGGSAGQGAIFRMDRTGGSYLLLRSFQNTANDGRLPTAALWLGSDSALYGTTQYGGTNDTGSAFRINQSGTGYTNLWSFGVSNGDGQNPTASLVEATNGLIYGTTYYGGSAQAGTVFQMKKNGTSYAVLWSFERSGGDGLNPQSSLVEATNGLLYGTTYYGGNADSGTVFALNKDGSSYSVLKSFDATGAGGQNPRSALCLGADGVLYGTTEAGGAAGLGTVFKLNPDGTGYLVLRSFGSDPVDGQVPRATLLQGSDGAFYGTTTAGGDAGYGTIFKMARDGSAYEVLWSFGRTPGDGQSPNAALMEADDGLLYGTTPYGGQTGEGTVFGLTRLGADYQVLWSFGTNANDGLNPSCALVETPNGMLYGTTELGGSAGYGTLFELDRDSGDLTVRWNFGSVAGDGQRPIAGLVQGLDSALYGTASVGGQAGFGTVFKFNADGSGYSVLWNFSAAGGDGSYPSAPLMQGTDSALYASSSGGGELDFGTIVRFVLPPTLFNSARLGSAFSFQFVSVSNMVYRPQSKALLSSSNWVALPSVVGTGGIMTITDTNQSSSTRFYRVLSP